MILQYNLKSQKIQQLVLQLCLMNGLGLHLTQVVMYQEREP